MKKQIVKKLYKDTNTVTKLTLIAKKAKDNGNKFSSLAYLLDEEYLLTCYKRLERRKAAGIDGKTVESYSLEEIKSEIAKAVEALKGGTYQPQPVRRVLIPKDDGKMRGLGIPTVIDKIIQYGVAWILNSIYESTFLNSSYGYRMGKDAHACLKEINHMIMQKKVNYIIDCDIKGFFDNVDHGTMMRCLEQRINDPKFRRIIWKMLKSGVMENGLYQQTDKGTPQGGIISPVLANIYLHYVLDLWIKVKEERKLRGYAQLIRYADDFVIGAQHKEEAEMLLKDITERLKQFGLELSMEKTKIIEFGRFAQENRKKRKEGKPETFTFLGFTHYCTTTQDGRFMVKVKTSRKKMRKAITSMKFYLKTNRTKKLSQIREGVSIRLNGHFNYYGVSGNIESIIRFHNKTRYLMFKWLNRRSQKWSFSWERFQKYLMYNPLPKPKLTCAIYKTW